MSAVDVNNVLLTKWLILDLGADINQCVSLRLDNILHYTARKGDSHIDILTFLLQQAASDNFLLHQTNVGGRQAYFI